MLGPPRLLVKIDAICDALHYVIEISQPCLEFELEAVDPRKPGGHRVKKKPIPERWSQDYTSVSTLHKLPDKPLHALKTAIEEIWALETERDRLLQDASLLKASLKDLQACRKDNIKLLHQKHGLEDALQKCWERLTKLEKNI